MPNQTNYILYTVFKKKHNGDFGEMLKRYILMFIKFANLYKDLRVLFRFPYEREHFYII